MQSEFLLTDAIRPGPGGEIIPRQGYRAGIFKDPEDEIETPVLAASISREKLFDVFLDLLSPLGDVVNVILETSHEAKAGKHHDLHREGIDLPVLQSHFCDHEDLLLNDGCTGVAVISLQDRLEIQFDEHKLLIVYAYDLEPFERVLQEYGARRDNRLRLICEAEHFHRTLPRYAEEFEQLAYHLGATGSPQFGVRSS